MNKLDFQEQEHVGHMGCIGLFLILLSAIICMWPSKTDSAVSKILDNGLYISVMAYPPPPLQQEQHVAYSDEEAIVSAASDSDDAYTNSEISNGWQHYIKKAGDFISENPEAVMQVIQGGMYLFGDYKPGGGGHMQHYNHEGKYDKQRGSIIEQLLL